MAEAYLRHDRERRDGRLRDAYLERIAGARARTALVRPTGQLVMAVPPGWLPGLAGTPAPGRELVLPGGGAADVEALPGDEALVVWERRSAVPTLRPVRLELLSRRPRLHRPGDTRPLSGRHAEILCALLLAGRGLTVEELTREVYRKGGKPVTLRAEMSRLRGALGGLLRARPYGFAVPVTSDLQDAEARLREGRLAEALELARDRLLPDSDAPRVVEARERLEQGLRAAALASGDPALLDAWCAGAAGEWDAGAARALVDLLPPGDARRPAALARVTRIAHQFLEPRPRR